MSEEEFVTVKRAADILGLSERHVRRLSQKLDPKDRLESGQSPVRVRLESVRNLSQRTDMSPRSQANYAVVTDSESARTSESPKDILPDMAAIVASYEAVIRAKDETIAVLKQANEDLRRMLPSGPSEAEPQAVSAVTTKTKPRRWFWQRRKE